MFEDKLLKDGKCILLAYDQGLEHGPTDFNDKNVDPAYIMELAEKGQFNGIIFQKGIAEKYYKKESNIPLIVKLNGKTKLEKGDPISHQLCSVKEAIDLGATGVGYTIYVGSKHEGEMFEEFAKIVEEAHNNKMPVIVWMYPRGENIKDEFDKDILAYAARIALELGADIVKMKYNKNQDDLKWIVKSAGKTKVIIAGGSKLSDEELLKEVREEIGAGTSGLAIGRNIWQRDNPYEIIGKLKEIIWG
jgi:class I fructose-bisphosphate aldolase